MLGAERGRVAAAGCLALGLAGAAGCQDFLNALAVPPSRYAGCWRFQAQLSTADRSRDFIERDFVIEIDATGAVTRVLMRREAEGIDNPEDPAATFVNLLSPQAAATLAAAQFAGRGSGDPASPDVLYNSDITANGVSFTVAAALVFPATNVTRYALNARVQVSGDQITAVTGTFIDQADANGVLEIRELLTGPGRVSQQTFCPANVVEVCDRFHDTVRGTTARRFIAVDRTFSLGGQAVVAATPLTTTTGELHFIDLATGGRRFVVQLGSVVQGRMAVDESRGRLYVPTENDVGNNALLTVDAATGTVIGSMELKTTGCIDFGTRPAAAVIPSTGQVLVAASAEGDTFSGVLRVDPVSGQVLGALQNAHLTAAAFFDPREVVVIENANVAVVANAGANSLVLVPLDAITQAIRGGDGAACRDATPVTTLVTAATDGTAVNGMAIDVADRRGIVVLRGTTDTSNDGRYQVFTVSGSGAGATLNVGPAVNLSRPTHPYGVAVDAERDQAYVVNAEMATFVVNLNTGALAGSVESIGTAGVSFLSAVEGRSRLLQAGNNPVVGEFCVP